MHHAAAAEFQPLALAARVFPVHGEVGAGFHEGVIAGLKACLGARPVQPARHFGNRTLEVAHADAVAHHQPFQLVKHRLMGGVGRLVAVDLAAHHDLEGRLVVHHVANLHGRGVGPQQASVFQPEGVLQVARGVIPRHVERLEVVVLLFHFRPLDHRVAHLAVDADQVVEHAGNGVQPARRQGQARQRHVDGFAGKFSVECRALEG